MSKPRALSWRQQQALDLLCDGQTYTCRRVAQMIGAGHATAYCALTKLCNRGYAKRKVVNGVAYYCIAGGKPKKSKEKVGTPVEQYLSGLGQTTLGLFIRGLPLPQTQRPQTK